MRWSHRRAASALKNGGVIAYPTEAVYGLGCHPLNEAAVSHLLQLKQRDPGKGLILISDKLSRLEPFLQPLSKAERNKIVKKSSKPITWIIPAQDWVPSWLTGWHGTLAVRVTDHPIAAQLCKSAGMPIVSTSANITGHHPAKTSLQVRIQFGEQLDGIVAGKIDFTAKPSIIRNLKTDNIIRAN
ncbi:MAG: Sua5/YciO/YrdC/YwlC family protein [Sulfuriflexus sp.]|nr:Sua5/YciO/YrdC/YwlC family protein [Sulfuriflexus sp.]